MTAAVPSRLGQDNIAGDVRALFMKKFTGEVLTAFDQKNVTLERHTIRNITDGKSASFANTGRARGRYHTPGNEITGQNIRHSETIINLDDLLIADVFLANLDEAMNHYEVRGEYSKQLGAALARTFDKQVLRNKFKAAKATNKIQGLPGGTTLTLPSGYAAMTNEDKARAFAEAVFTGVQTAVEKDVDPDELMLYVRPVDYYRLVQFKDLLNKEWGGKGSYADADLPQVAGVPLIMSNHIPSQNDATSLVGGEIIDNGDVIHTNHSVDARKLQALLVTPASVGTVKLIDMALESQYDIRRQGHLFVAKMAVGHGVLRPECAMSIETE